MHSCMLVSDSGAGGFNLVDESVRIWDLATRIDFLCVQWPYRLGGVSRILTGRPLPSLGNRA